MDGTETSRLLRDWKQFVKRAEAGIAAHLTGCPQCDELDGRGLESRGELEALIHRGGRRGFRIARRVDALDERFRRATTPSPNGPKGDGWWRYRNLD